MDSIKGTLILLAAITVWGPSLHALTFKQEQLRHAHVQAAYREKEAAVKKRFADKGITFPPGKLFIRIFKREAQVELWAASRPADPLSLVATYGICSSSGELGPKRQRGDCQVPEGFYRINHFNPESSFYLSLGVSYPNRSDQILKTGRDPGGAIYIHGDCVTIGCMPITDEKIKELYVAALDASDQNRREITVHIFPARLDSAGFAALQREFGEDRKLIAFWTNLKQGYDRFERDRIVPTVSISAKGKYLFAR
jgi:murein L,D-transpeptidase YafK